MLLKVTSAQASSKSRFASLSSISESSTPSKATSLNSSRVLLASSPTPILSKSASGKLSADFSTPSKALTAKPSGDYPFLLSSNSRQGNGMKSSGQPKSGRDGGISDGNSLPPVGRESLSSMTTTPGSKLMRLGRNTSSGLSGEPRPSPDTPRPPLEHGKGIQRSGQGTGGSYAAGKTLQACALV